MARRRGTTPSQSFDTRSRRYGGTVHARCFVFVCGFSAVCVKCAIYIREPRDPFSPNWLTLGSAVQVLIGTLRGIASFASLIVFTRRSPGKWQNLPAIVLVFAFAMLCVSAPPQTSPPSQLPRPNPDVAPNPNVAPLPRCVGFSPSSASSPCTKCVPQVERGVGR